MEKTEAQKRARVGGKVECGALRLGRGGLAAPGATRVQNRRWQSPECCQRARMNRGDLFLSRCALPERGVQREWPSTITNGQKLVLMFRLLQIIFFRCGFWAKTAASQKAVVPCQNSSWDEKWYGFSGEKARTQSLLPPRTETLEGRNPCARTAHIHQDGRKFDPDQAARS